MRGHGQRPQEEEEEEVEVEEEEEEGSCGGWGLEANKRYRKNMKTEML